ncbi:MAG: gstB [Gammaproteobacteria bacterium]|jgi:glutathione S-transferase|nr:gstB [Gammaproteobacteria bacterium]
MKLYYSKGACSLAVRIVINELNLACEFEAVNLKTHVTENTVDFYSINPKGAVPTLILDKGERLTENNVIQQYLAETHSNGSSLLPKAGLERYRVLEWMNYVTTEMHKGCSPFFNPNIPEELKEQVFKPLMLKKLSHLDSILAKSDYLTGKHFCLADGYLFVVLRWLPALKINRADYSHIEAYFNRLLQRPAIIKSLNEEQLAVS